MEKRLRHRNREGSSVIKAMSFIGGKSSRGASDTATGKLEAKSSVDEETPTSQEDGKPNDSESKSSIITKVNSGVFTSLAFDAKTSKLYAARIGSNGKTKLHVCESAKLKKLKEFHTKPPIDLYPKTHVTLAVGKDQLYVCSTLNGNIQVISLENSTLMTPLGSKGKGGPSLLAEPRLSDIDRSGTLLVSDSGHDRLQTVTSDGEWEIVELNPTLENPRGAARIGRNLFTTSAQDCKLSLYAFGMA